MAGSRLGKAQENTSNNLQQDKIGKIMNVHKKAAHATNV